MIIGKAISPFALRKKGTAVVPTDPDAQAFITATGISGTNATATNKLVIDLKSANIWTKMKAIYPFVGNTASSQKFNLKDPRDLNAAFRLVFSGGGTFSANGYQPGGVNGFANTFLTPSTSLLLNSVHLSYYCRTNNLSGGIHMGVDSAIPDTYLYQSYGPLGLASTLNTASVDYINNTVANSLGLSISSRTTSTNVALYKSGVKLKSDIKSSATLPVLNIALGARNASGVISNFDNKQCAFASIGDGLSDAEALALYNAVNAFQVTLARNV
jgi:hypothetical protein